MRPEYDTGTAELVLKRLKGETAEALDLCLERNLITREQHWCGIHLRWLYTLRFGAPGVRAVDTAHIGGFDTKHNDPEWIVAREKEYQDALLLLSRSGHTTPVMSVCVFNERPPFLQYPRQVSRNHAQQATESLSYFRTGMDVLAHHWARE